MSGLHETGNNGQNAGLKPETEAFGGVGRGPGALLLVGVILCMYVTD